MAQFEISHHKSVPTERGAFDVTGPKLALGVSAHGVSAAQKIPLVNRNDVVVARGIRQNRPPLKAFEKDPFSNRPIKPADATFEFVKTDVAGQITGPFFIRPDNSPAHRRKKRIVRVVIGKRRTNRANVGKSRGLSLGAGFRDTRSLIA